MKDKFFRDINYMRISVTNRCNMRCNYCMPNVVKNLCENGILTDNEIIETARASVRCGIVKFKLTGGEPLLRPKIAEIIYKLKNISGVESVSMTTNGALLAENINELQKSGLDSVNISLDSLDTKRFEKITGFNLLDKVLEGIDAAISSGIHTKINTVLQKGINDDEWEKILLIAKENPIDIRFIELMPIGEGKNFFGISNEKILNDIRKKYQGVENDFSVHGNGPAVYIKIPGFLGGVGFISAMCGRFCSSCNRLRLTAQGKLKPCLSFADYLDVREILRSGEKNLIPDKLENIIKKAIEMKPREHCFETPVKNSETLRMFEIGG